MNPAGMKTCTECEEPARSRGMCNAHYARKRRADRAARYVASRTTEARMRPTERVAEMNHLIDGGVWPVEAARRVGYTLSSAATAAQRLGDDRLLSVLYRERAYMREVA